MLEFEFETKKLISIIPHFLEENQLKLNWNVVLFESNSRIYHALKFTLTGSSQCRINHLEL